MARALPLTSLGIGSGVKTIKFDILAGQPLTAFAAHTLKWTMPERGKIIGVRLNVGLRGGTHVTSALDITAGGTSILAAAFDVDALTPATPVDKEIASLAAGAADIAANTEMTIAITEASGTNPTWADVTVQIEYVRLGG